MKTATWDTWKFFETPKRGGQVRFVNSRLEMPDGVDEAIRENWENQLDEKLAELKERGFSIEKKPYHLDPSENPLNALYEGDKPKMWPGPVVSLKEVNENGETIDLVVGQTSFPFIHGMKDPKIKRLYDESGIPKPRPALGIVTFPVTADGYLLLTVRGPKTNLYPGRWYAPGGNASSPDMDPAMHQRYEMLEEIMVDDTMYDPNEFRFGGIDIDTEDLPGKPDLTGWVKVPLTRDDLRKIFNKRPLSERPNDVVDITFAPADEAGLFDYLVNTTSIFQFCPPTHGALVFYGRHRFGEEWADEVLKEINR